MIWMRACGPIFRIDFEGYLNLPVINDALRVLRNARYASVEPVLRNAPKQVRKSVSGRQP